MFLDTQEPKVFPKIKYFSKVTHNVVSDCFVFLSGCIWPWITLTKYIELHKH